MRKKEQFFFVFFIFILISVVIFLLSLGGHLKLVVSVLEKRTAEIQGITFGVFQRLPFVSQDSKIKTLKDENLNLLSKISDYEKLKRENQALSDQFQTSYPRSVQLLKAEIIGAPGFIPGVSVPTNFILNKGSKDNIKVGQAVVIKNNLVGTITTVSINLSYVNIVNNSSSSFTAKTENGAQGIVRGGGSLTLDNVLLSESIKEGELVLTYGDINPDGIGIPADLIVGKITSVEKNPSDLFQKAKIESFVDLPTLSTVFIYLENK